MDAKVTGKQGQCYSQEKLHVNNVEMHKLIPNVDTIYPFLTYTNK